MRTLPRSAAEFAQWVVGLMGVVATSSAGASIMVDAFDTGIAVPQGWSPSMDLDVSQSGPGILGRRRASVVHTGDWMWSERSSQFVNGVGHVTVQWTSGGVPGASWSVDTSTRISFSYGEFGLVDLSSVDARLRVEGTGWASLERNASVYHGVTVRSGSDVGTVQVGGISVPGGAVEFSVAALAASVNLSAVDSIEFWLESVESSVSEWNPMPGPGWDPLSGAGIEGGEYVWVPSRTEASFTLSGISIVPAPAAAPALLALGALVRSRRRA